MDRLSEDSNGDVRNLAVTLSAIVSILDACYCKKSHVWKGYDIV